MSAALAPSRSSSESGVQALHPARGGERGFTLVEMLIAIALLTIAIVGVGAALTLQTGGLSGGATFGLAAISRANSISTATMLAQERIEQAKNTAYASIGNLTESSLAGYPTFRRLTSVVSDSPVAGAKTVTVQVFFRPPLEAGLGREESVKLVTIIANRPS